MSRLLLVVSLLTTRGAVRTIILCICTIALLAELPQLADFFRAPQNLGNINILVDAPRPRALDPRQASPSPSSVSKEHAALRAATAASSPANEDELVAAIQKELVRIGYYNGPVTTVWSDAVRDAVRKFTGKPGTKPTQQLLIALLATKPEDSGSVARQGGSINLQAAQDVLNGRAQAAPPAISHEDAVLSDGYLPPEALRGRELVQSVPGLAVPVAARSSRIDTRRRGRRSYASARRRSRFVFGYGGFFGF